MFRCVKVLALKSGNLSSNPRIHVVEKKKTATNSSLNSTLALKHIHMCTVFIHTKNRKINVKYQSIILDFYVLKIYLE